ncbi:MAG: hypothetical protein OXC70_07345 [Gammaproteobacteria bacterium]|nr:hypothetical protein [Gammaproteobacteria bacterium]
MRALREIRVGAEPSWNHDAVKLRIWFIKDRDSEVANHDWSELVDMWSGLFDESGRFSVEAAVACGLEDMMAHEYVESDVFDLDRLSVERVRS